MGENIQENKRKLNKIVTLLLHAVRQFLETYIKYDYLE